MANETKTDPKTVPAKKPGRTDEQLLKASIAEMATFTEEEVKRARALIAAGDKARKAADPNAKGILPDRSYTKQEMDELMDVLGDLANGNTDVSDAYVKLGKAEAIELRDAVVKVIRLGKKIVTPGHVFDLRFDQRGHGWAKLTENWRKNGPADDKGEATNKMQEFFDSYKDNPTVPLL